MNTQEGQPNTGASSDDDLEQIDPAVEMQLLKDRAKMMGITFSNNIGKESLLAKITAKMEGEKDTTDADGKAVEAAPKVNPLAPIATTKEGKPLSVREQLIKEQMKLVRLRITNLDPKKKDLPGEVLTVANRYLGTVRKFIPFGEVTDDGYHVPFCLYQLLESRRFLNIRTRKKDGKIIVEQSWAKEFALDVLDPLTPAELAQLATAQIAAGTSNSKNDDTL